MAVVSVEGVPVYYRRFGSESAPPVLLLHGWGCDSRIFETLCHELESDFYVVVPDLPGFGKSQAPPETWEMADYGRVFSRFIDALGIDRPTVLGHSFGGRIAIVLAARYPQKVAKLILVDSAGFRPALRRLRAGVLAGASKAVSRCMPADFKEYARPLVYKFLGNRDYAQAGPLKGTFVKVINEDLTQYVRSISKPTLIIWGSEDRETPVAFARRFKSLIESSEVLIIHGSGHYSFRDWTGQHLARVREFIGSK